MSTMNVFVGNLQLPPFPAGQPASEVYRTLKDAYGGGILVGPNGVGILNNGNLIPAGNYTYVPAAVVVPRAGVPPFATPRVGPYATFTYGGSTGITPHVSGVAPQTPGAPPHSSGVFPQVPTTSHAAAPAHSTARTSPRVATTKASARATAKAPRTPESQVPPTVEASCFHDGGNLQEQKGESASPIRNLPGGVGGGGSSRPTATITTGARGKLPDWSPQELKMLILAKKQEWEHATCGTPLQKKLANGKEKWKIVADFLANEGMKNPVRDHSSCKKKWEKVTGEFKKVYDYERIVRLINTNESYYAMSASERRSKSLPGNFSEDVYNMMVDWLPSKQETEPSPLPVVDTSTRNVDGEVPATGTKTSLGDAAPEPCALT